MEFCGDFCHHQNPKEQKNVGKCQISERSKKNIYRVGMGDQEIDHNNKVNMKLSDVRYIQRFSTFEAVQDAHLH